MKNSNFIKNSIIALLPISMSLAVIFGVNNKTVSEAKGYNSTSLSKMDIYLNDTPENSVRSYYSGLNSFSDAQRTGTNLLKNLKPILMNNQKYYNYDSGDNIWRLYEIADRDWVKSPASAAPNATYDAVNNVLKNYTFKYSSGDDAGNPYLHSLYVNRDAENLKRAWGDHGNRNSEATIEREHIWPKSHGFQDNGDEAGGARGDPMHLWSADGNANGLHNYYFYGYVDKTKSYTDCGDKFSSIAGNLLGYSKTVGGSSSVFEPQDCDKGDIARACFYMVARYNNYAGTDSTIGVNNPNLCLSDTIDQRTGVSTSTDAYSLGILSDLLEWNKIDPPDEFEIHRNNLLYTNFTNNRNPFIDFPDWADICFGSSAKAADPVSDALNGKGSVKTLKSISVTSNPSKTTYEEGESFSPTGMVVTALYSDGSTETITDYTYSPTEALTLGTTSITISYLDKTATVNITVVKKGSEVDRYFQKVTSGLISGKYLIVCDENSVAWKTGASGSTNSIAVTYDKGNIVYTSELGCALFTFDVSNGSIFAPNNKYIYQDSDTTGIKLSESPVSNTITLNSGILDVQTSGGARLRCNYNSGKPTFNLYASGSYLKYKDINLYRLIENTEVVHPTSVTVSPNTTTLDVGSSVTLSASVLPDNATDKTVTWSSSDSTIATVNQDGRVVAKAAGSVQIYATSNDSSVSVSGYCTITVNAPIVLDRIEIDNSSTYKTDYYVDDEFNKIGIKVNAIYKQGGVDVETIDASTEVEYSGFDSSTIGTKTITISYEGKTTSYQINVSEVPIELNTVRIISSTLGFENATEVKSISQEGYNVEFKTDYTSSKYYTSGGSIRVYGGNSFTINGPYKIIAVSFVFGTYDQSNSISVDSGTCDSNTGAWSDSNGVDKLTFTVNGTGGQRRFAEMRITYDPTKPSTVELTSISLSGTYKTVFTKGEDFDSTGLIVTAYFNDGSSSTVSPASITGYDTSVVGKQTVTVSVTDLTITKQATYEIEVKDSVVLSSITLSGTYKTEFLVGDDFTREGLIVTAHYSDSSEAIVNPTSISGYNMNVPSDSQTVTVYYKEGDVEVYTNYSIKVIDILPVSLTVSGTQPTSFYCGDSFSYTGLVAIVQYNDGSYLDVNPTNVYGYDMDKVGKQTVTVEWVEKGVTVTDTYQIEILQIVPNSLRILGDFKKNFFVGDTFNYDGLIAKVGLNNGKNKEVNPVVSTPDMSTPGDKTVNVSYTENNVTVSNSYTITVTAVIPTQLNIVSTPTKITYFCGEELNVDGLVVSATYNNGTSKVVIPTSVTGYNKDVAGQQTVTVSYVENGVTVSNSFKVTVIAVVPTELDIVSAPTKTSYFIGEDLNLEGLSINVTYNNGTTQVVTPTNVSGYNKQILGEQTVTVSYSENDVTVTNTFKVNVLNIDLTHIEISGDYKKEYEYGENFSDNGLVITAYYSNGTNKVVSPTSISGYNAIKPGDQTITVSYTENGITSTASFQVTVKSKPVTPASNKTVIILASAIGGSTVVLGGIIGIIIHAVLKRRKGI